VGRADLMMEMEHIFFSSTFGGEALSLATSIAVIDKMRREPVIETLWKTGEALANGAQAHIDRHGLGDVIKFAGLAPWKLLTFLDHARATKEEIKTLFIREMLRAGVLIAGSNNVCYAHGAEDVAQILAAYAATLGTIAEELDKGNVGERLGCPPIRPVFAVR
jgi:glutamate-1-semialdehyde 2,1-aminomutase